MQHKLTTFLWFDGQAEEAAAFYVSIFQGSRILNTTLYGEAGPGPTGSVLTVDFEIEGHRFVALNGGPVYNFTPAISFAVQCATQPEIDDLWAKLSAGGEELDCGWVKDRYGVTWQVVPVGLGDLLNGADPVRSQRATRAMLTMKKLDIDALRRAYEGV